MDFWKIVGLVFMLCTIIDLPYFVVELREDKQKKQAKAYEPVWAKKALTDRSETKYNLENHTQGKL